MRIHSVYGVFGVDSKTLRNHLMVASNIPLLCVMILFIHKSSSQAQKDRVLDDMKATMATALKESCNKVLSEYQVLASHFSSFLCSLQL